MGRKYIVRLFRFREGAVSMDFNQIYDMAKPKVTSMLKSHFPGVDMLDIQGYYNTAMVQVYEKLEADSLSEDMTLARYIYIIARNHLIDDLRKNNRHRELFVDQDFLFDDRWATAGIEEIKGADPALLDAVEDIVSHLEFPCDTIIPSRYYEKIKWSVVAKMSGYSSEKSVHSGHKTCLNKIRAVIMDRYRNLCDFL